MRVAVYSGSFNPLHNGHKSIISHAGEKFDMVYLVVSPQNPLKQPCEGDISGLERLRAAREAVARHGLNARVEDIEINMPAPHYTIRTLDALREREPENRFTLVIGADNLYRMRRWKDYGRILSEYGVLVYPRSGYDMVELRNGLMEENPQYRIELAEDAPIVDVSSTEIRTGLAEGRDMSSLTM